MKKAELTDVQARTEGKDDLFYWDDLEGKTVAKKLHNRTKQWGGTGIQGSIYSTHPKS